MTRPLVVLAVCALAAACGPGRGEIPEPIEQTGCLTGAEGRFVLTDLDPGNTEAQPSAATETYQLVGNEDELRQYVGQQVRIAGEAEPATIVEARETTPPAPVGTAGQAEPQPQVSTQAQTRVETRRLRVSSVTPTGDDCGDIP